MQFTVVAALLASLPFIAAIPTARELQARADCELTTGYIGAEHNVEVQYFKCAADGTTFVPRGLEARQTTVSNVCGAQCNTYTSSSSAFTPGDCTVIADALKYESQASVAGNEFNITAASTNTTNYVLLTYSSCKSVFVNQDPANNTLTYCRTDLSSLTTWLGVQDSATAGKGGICVAADSRWFVQVVHS